MPLPHIQEYTPVSPVDSDSEKGEADSFLSHSPETPRQHEEQPKRLSSLILHLLPWFLTVFFACLSLFLTLERMLANPHGTYESDFDSDLLFNDKNIPLEQIRFTGSPHFTENGTGWLDPVNVTAPWPENLTFFGPASHEIEKNWQAFIGKRYFSISEEEATRAWGEDRFQYIDHERGGYTAGLEVFHTLHCLNAIRMAVYSGYKPHHEEHGPFHIDHCFDALRQTIMCYGSTTLIPSKFRTGMARQYIDSDQLHTCRSFTFLRDFVDMRAKGQPLYVERDMSIVDPVLHKIAVEHWKSYTHRPAHEHEHEDEHEHDT